MLHAVSLLTQAQGAAPIAWLEGTPWWIPLTQAVAVALIAALGTLVLRRRF